MSETKERRLAAAREYKKANRDCIREWQNARNAAVRADPQRNAEKLAANRASAKKNADKRRAYDRARDRQKVLARGVIRNRIYRGTLQRGPCEVCAKPDTHAHHDDYSKPLEVRWLCTKHHAETHHE